MVDRAPPVRSAKCEIYIRLCNSVTITKISDSFVSLLFNTDLVLSLIKIKHFNQNEMSMCFFQFNL